MPAPLVNLLTAYKDQWDSVSRAKNRAMQQLSDHTQSGVTSQSSTMQASEVRWSHPSSGACPRITHPLAGKHLISPFGTVTLQSFLCNYALLMLCNLARQNLGCSGTVIDISWRCFFPVASMKRPCLIMVRLGFLSLRLCVVPLTACGHDCTLCFHRHEAQCFPRVRLYQSL